MSRRSFKSSVGVPKSFSKYIQGRHGSERYGQGVKPVKVDSIASQRGFVGGNGRECGALLLYPSDADA